MSATVDVTQELKNSNKRRAPPEKCKEEQNTMSKVWFITGAGSGIGSWNGQGRITVGF
jgi:hypothetical protein